MHDGGRFVTGVSSFSLQPCIIAGGIAKHQQFTINEVNDHMFYGGVGIHSVHKAALCLGYDGTDVNFQLCRDWGMSKWFNLEFVEDTITPVAPVIVPTSSTQVSLQDILQNQVPFRLRSATQYNLCVTDKRGTGSRFGMYACDMFPSVDINPADKAFEYVAASKRLLSRNETDVCLRHDDVYGYPPATVDVHPCFSPQYHQMFNFDTLDNDTMAVKLRSDHNPELCLSFGQTTDTSYNVLMHFCTEENPNQVFILDDVGLPAIASGQGSVLADAPNDDCHPSLLHCKETSRSAMVLPCSTLEYIC